MFKKTAFLGILLALIIPVGCAQNQQADVDDQIEERLSSQNIKDVNADMKTDGRIELTGNVESEQQKAAAEQTARSLSGGKAVDNLIQVKYVDDSADPYVAKDKDVDVDKDKDVNKDVDTTPNDGWLAFKTKLGLYADTRVAGNDINVESNQGVVSLIGKVPNSDAKRAAVEVAHKVEGVKSVNDQLQIVPASQRKVVNDTDDNITKNVNTALDKVKDLDLAVTTNNGVVSLTGEADNMNQVHQALQHAYAVKGVKAVNADAVVIKKVEADAKTDKNVSKK